MGVGCGYVVPSAGLVRSQGLAVSGCGSGLICVWVLARLGSCDGRGPGFGAFGRSGARCCVRWRPSAFGLFGDFWAGPGVAPRGGGLLGNGVRWRRRWPGGQARRGVWCAGLLGCCGCRRCRCPDACGVAEGVCLCGAGLWVMSHRRMPSRCVSWRVSRRRLRTYGWSWGAGRLRGWTPRGWSASASMASDAACGIHPPAGRRRQFSTDPLRGRWTRPSREGSPRAHFRRSQSCVWVQRCHHCPWAGLRSWAEEWAWVGVTGRGDRWWQLAWGIPHSPVPWGCAGSGGARGCGPAGVRARSPPRGWAGTRGGGGSGACAACGLSSRVGRGAGALLADPGFVLAWSGAVRGPGVRALRGGGTRCAVLL